jgi:4-amino-4-deoxy-L-arabinose transferase-like glycosyltransferase
MLALAITIIAVSDPRGGGEKPRWMSPETALVAAIFCLTQAASIEKGRLAEIEGVYVAISGIAITLWLAFWARGRSPWLLWLVPAVFLGLGCLAKAPLHLLFFYTIAGAVLWQLRASPAPNLWMHVLALVAGLALMAAIVALWAIPYFRNEVTLDAAKVWQHQLVTHVGGKFNWQSWALAIPRGFCDHLPWLLFAPLLWRRDLAGLGERPAAVVRGGRLAVTGCFFAMLLTPGILPRYVQPLLAPFSCLLALTVADERLAPRAEIFRWWWRTNSILAGLILFAACAAPAVLVMVSRQNIIALHSERLADFTQYLTWPLIASSIASAIAIAALVGRWKLARPALIAATSGALVGAGMLIFASSGMPLINRHAPVRESAQQVDRQVPVGQKLYLFDPAIKPAIFYLTVPYQYAPELKDVPADAQWVLTRPERREKIMGDRPEFELVWEFPSKDKELQLLLFRRRAG